MTDTTVTVVRPSWLTHPIQAWRALLAAQAERADTDARAVGLTVEHLPGGVRRYRDPALDQLATHRADRSPYPGVRAEQDAGEAESWSTPTLTATGALVDQSRQATCAASPGAYTPDLLALKAGPTASATSSAVRLRRAVPAAVGPRR
jgi:hypothetical protein